VNPRLLIIDDDEDICMQMKWSLNQDYDLLLAHDSASALELFRTAPTPAVLLDLGLPPNPANSSEGLRVLTEMLAIDPYVKIIIITGQSEQTIALEAISRGAYDFLAKPIQMDVLKVILHRALYVANLERECRKLQEMVLRNGFEGMLGASPAITEAFSTIRKVASTNASVLILGESGTGKEMAALAIHRNSRRKDGPFVPINCGAIPETLLESELFGHEKGAFTGAHLQRPGRIESANHGTLFLDEISEITPPLQVKLLRFLQEQRIERIGGRKEIQTDIRVIAATNADLTKAMQNGKFREDLYYRLAVVTLKLPALRDRQGDIHLLAQAFVHRYAKEFGKDSMTISAGALRSLQQHTWPGNVRELENRIKRAVIMAEGSSVTSADLELNAATSAPAINTLHDAREAVEREMVEQALRRCNGKVSAASAALGISRPTLYELMEKLGIRKKKDSETSSTQE
jgi:two-component system, NtrC family, response regulator